MDKPVVGHATPISFGYNPTYPPAVGITLRDYFAAKAMQGWLASFGPEDRHPSNAGTLDMFASQAYAVADAMLEARSK